MSKKLVSAVIVIIAIVFLIAGSIAVITLSDLLLPIIPIPTQTKSFEKFTVLVVVVDDIQSPAEIDKMLLGFVTTVPNTTVVVERMQAPTAGFVSGNNIDIQKLIQNAEGIVGIEITHFLIADMDSIEIINNLYENLQNRSVLTKDEDLCRILEISEIEVITQILSSISGHFESDINNDELLKVFIMMKDSSDCYYEVIEK